MRNWLAVGVVGVVSGVFLGGFTGGCSSSSPPASVATYCAEVAQTECGPVVGLCTGVNESACESAVEANCNASAEAAQKSGRTFQAGNVGACITALNSVYSTLNPNSLSVLSWQRLNGTCGTANPCPGSPNDICQQVFQGTTPTDDACTVNYDCTSGDICGSNNTCGPEADKSLNQGCDDPGDLCAQGTVCAQNPGTTVFVCTEGGQVSDSCTADLPCGTGAECLKGKCVALGQENAPCASNADCDAANPDAAFCDTSGTKPVCTAGYDFGNGAPDCSAFGGAK